MPFTVLQLSYSPILWKSLRVGPGNLIILMQRYQPKPICLPIKQRAIHKQRP